jgi:NitT/TauT family transport system substrate-binding protein
MVNVIKKIVAAAGFAAALAIGAGAQAQPIKIRISWVAIPNNLPPLFMEKPEMMSRVGQSYTIDAIRFPGTPQSVAALASGDLDIALLTFSSFPLAIQNAKLDDLRIISDEFVDGVAGHYSAEFLVLKDGPINKIEDLKGKTVAVNVRGGGTDMALRAITKKHGLEEKRDYTAVEVSFGNMKATLLEKKVDLVGLGVPAFSADPVLRSQVRPLFTQRDALGPTAQVIWVARDGFLQKNRAVVIDFLTDALRARRYFTDPKNHTEMVDIVARVNKQPREQIDPWLFTKSDFYRSPDGVLDLGILQSNIKQMVELGFLKSSIDVKKYQDFSMIKEAAQRLNQ